MAWMARGREFNVAELVSALQLLSARRIVAAGFCVVAGLSTAQLLRSESASKSAPALVVALPTDVGAGTMTTKEALAEARKALSANDVLRRASGDLSLGDLQPFAGGNPEAYLASILQVSPTDRPSIIEVGATSGEPVVDTMIANYLARDLARQTAPAAATEGEKPPAIQFKFVRRATTVPGQATWLYQVEALVLGVLSAASILALGLARALRRQKPKAVVAPPVVAEPVVPRGILEQVDMLERMWPSTGRTNILPEGSNDDPEQRSLKPARAIVTRMSEIRAEALRAMEGPSEEALENVLTDMQALRDQVRWITAEQMRRRRRSMSI